MTSRRSDAGQAIVVVALGMVVILGFLGLGLDFGYLRYLKREVQRSADAAAIAGAAELPNCAGVSACSNMTAAAKAALTENGFTGSTLGTSGCGTSTVTGNLIVTVNNPPCYLGSADPHNGDKDYVEVLVAQVAPLSFASIFGVQSLTLLARSEAGMNSDLIYALGVINPSPALTVANNAVSVSTVGGVVDDGSAFQCNGASFTAPYIGIVGQNSGGSGRHFFRGSGCTYPQASPTYGISTPVYGTSASPDPLNSQQATLEHDAWQQVGGDNCGTSTSSPYSGHNGKLTITGTAVLGQGVYCGGIVIANTTYHGGNTTNVTFNPGIYILKDSGGSGGLTIDQFTTVSGNGVGFYNFGPTGAINMQCQFCGAGFGSRGSVTLVAPDGGNCSSCPTSWQGILFFQDSQDLSPATIVGSTTYGTAATGTVYFPSATVNYANNNTVDYNLVVADKINLGVNWNGWIGAFFYNFFSRHRLRSPLHGTGGVGIVE